MAQQRRPPFVPPFAPSQVVSAAAGQTPSRSASGPLGPRPHSRSSQQLTLRGVTMVSRSHVGQPAGLLPRRDHRWNVSQRTQNHVNPLKRVGLRLADFDIVLMRKDPPVDVNYLHATWILDHARGHSCPQHREAAGTAFAVHVAAGRKVQCR
jgi:hypothetical protein